MSSLRTGMLRAALILSLVAGSTTPAWARPGVWAYLRDGNSFTITLVNLTEYPLQITENSFSLSCVQLSSTSMPYKCSEYTSNPFQGHGTLNLDPYRTAIWQSGGARSDGGFAWAGHLSVKPEGMDKWGVSVNTKTESPNWTISHPNQGKGTWVYLQTDFSATTGNPDWSQMWNSFAYGIWVNPDFLTDYTHMENVMTLSGTKLAVSLYSNNYNRVTLVFRETFLNGAEGDDYAGWKLSFVDNGANSVP